ncbi:PREDICTED: cation/H(+) antiporter 19-like [Populus euphratica]|uniref:Cation/H(+) antiporter 19-like n=1 Tax=Populus euphratica TaxID=75702 RepID=A0AAJ6WZ23_POPEU|nr:PREDICTED: cation/H(+) antiporter 19-like [Populus euphratica]
MATNTINVTAALPKPMKATSNGAFQHENPLDYALPLLILQICLVVAFTRTLAFLHKPLRQPRVIAEIIGGILLGPSALGRSERFLHTVFPPKSMTVLDTVANIGLLFFLFLVGLELDIRSIRRTGKKSLAIAGAGITLPFLLGIGTSFVLRSTISKGSAHAPFLVFMGVSLSITAFPVLARFLAELKLRVLIEKIEDLVAGLFLPLYFASSGLKTNVATISGAQSWGLLVLVIATACFGKIIGTLIVSRMFFKVPFREAAALGFLMNTKGLVELIVLNIGKDRKVLNDQTFAVLVLMALFTTFITTPIVMAVYKPARKGAPYKNRTVKRKDLDTELRLLACFHSSRNIPTMINLVECSRGTRQRGRLCVYAMHLMELSERSSAISMVHKARKNGLPFWNKKRDDRDQMVIAFEAYQQLSSVTIRPMTAISALNTIYEDICTSAHQKRAAMILLPFHKHQRVDGSLESLGHSLQEVNQRVLRHSPCSVGILIDRGFGGTTQVSASDVSSKIVVPFFGGSDDMEALAYGMRMAEHPGIMLTVLKFVPASGKTLLTLEGHDTNVNRVENDKNSNSQADSEIFFSEFVQHAAKQLQDSVTHEERVVESKADVVAALKSMSKSNLFMVGRMPPIAPLLISTDTPELGPVGSILASSNFSNTASVLVIQHYYPNGNLHPFVEEEENKVTDDGTDTLV